MDFRGRATKDQPHGSWPEGRERLADGTDRTDRVGSDRIRQLPAVGRELLGAGPATNNDPGRMATSTEQFPLATIESAFVLTSMLANYFRFVGLAFGTLGALAWGSPMFLETRPVRVEGAGQSVWRDGFGDRLRKASSSASGTDRHGDPLRSRGGDATGHDAAFRQTPYIQDTSIYSPDGQLVRDGKLWRTSSTPGTHEMVGELRVLDVRIDNSAMRFCLLTRCREDVDRAAVGSRIRF